MILLKYLSGQNKYMSPVNNNNKMVSFDLNVLFTNRKLQ